jgi:hypothetical protein
MNTYVIVYKYRGRLESTTTKPCTLEQATRAFHEDFNSLGTFELVSITAQ